MGSINLRAAWEVAIPPPSGLSATRVDLPIDWSASPWPSGRIRLIRRFGRPPRLDEETPARLRLIGFEGVEAVVLNGEAVFLHENGLVGPFRPRPRNILEIVVDIDQAARSTSMWGRSAQLEFDPA